MPCRRNGPVLPVVVRAVEGAVGEGPVARVVAEVAPTPDERVVGSMVVRAGMFGRESDSESTSRQNL